MVNYKLGIYNKKEGRIIDLEKIIKITKLEKLDEFTSAFNNEEEFKLYLLNQGLISNQEIKQNISVNYKYSGKVKKLPIIYQDMKKKLDIVYLRYELKGLCGNLEFLEKLARHYSIGNDKYNPQGLNVSDIRHYLSDVRSNAGEPFYSKSLEVAIEDLFKKAVFKSIDRNGEIIENYRGLRDLAIFIYKFKKDLEKKEENKKDLQKIKEENKAWVQSSMFDAETEITNYPILEEPQKDNNGKWILSSEGEPDFPPNSEEEANYKKYLEHLEEISNNESIENHPHYRR